MDSSSVLRRLDRLSDQASTSFRLVVRPAARSAASAAHVGLAAGGVAFILQR
jgi:hypothetical protein